MIKKEDPRFQHLSKKIGVFAVVALAVVAAAIFLIGMENDLFTHKYELKLTVEKGTGFTRGMAVKLSGFRIGRIASISLNEAATVDIVLQIDRKYQKWIRKDSTGKLVKEGLVGDAIIEVSVGTPALAMLNEGDQLAYLKTKALDELAEEIADSVKPVLKDVKEIIGYVNDPNGDIKQAMKNFNQLSGNLNVLSGNLEGTRQRADTLLLQAGSGVGTVSGKLAGVLDETSRTVKNANASLSQLNDRLPALLGHMEGSLANVEKISADLRQTEEKTLPAVPTLVRKSEDTIDGANGVLRAVQGIWPIRGNFPAPREQQFVPGDSHD